MKRALLLTALVLLSACSQAAAPSPAPSPTVAPIPKGQVLLALLGAGAGPSQTVDLFREDGAPAGTVRLPPGSGLLAVAGDRIFAVTSTGALQAIHRDGRVERLGFLGPNSGPFAPTPDGRRWIWLTQVVGSGDQTQTIHLAGDGIAPRVLAILPYPTVLAPYSWIARGLVLDSPPPDFFGYRPFDTPFAAFGMRVIDPKSGSIRTITTPSHCVFSDEAADGTIACFPTRPYYLVPNLHTIRMVSPGGRSTDLTLALPRFNYVGDAFFSRDGGLLTVAGATGVADTGQFSIHPNPNPQPEQFGADIIHVRDGSIARFGPSGVRLAMGHQSWLPDGKLVLWRPAGAAGGPPGLYVLDPAGNGQGPEVLASGNPIGYLSG